MRKRINNIVNHAEVSEKAIERYLVKRVRAAGGVCLKYANPNMVGYPDRLILLPDGYAMWVEVKSKGKKPAKIQAIRQAELESLGQYVNTVDNKESVDDIMETYNNWRAEHDI